MKKITMAALAAALLIGAVSSAFAQGAGPKNGGQGVAPGQKPGQQGPRGGGMRGRNQEILAKLNLTDKQKAQIKTITEKYQKQLQALRPAQKPGQPRTRPTDAERQKFMDIFKKMNTEIQAVLTPAQKAKYEAMMKEMREKMRNGGGRPGGPPPPANGAKGGKGKGGSTGGGI